MGNGSLPGPVSAPDPVHLDDGTMPRIGSPHPGPIGLDAKSGTAKQSSSASLSDQVVGFARRQQGDHVGDGQCFALADRALREAGAKSAADFGEVSPNADYVWGQPVRLSEIRPGDIVQFRNYRYDREVVTEHDDGSTSTSDDYQTRPHHTAIVHSVGADGAVTVLEQNAPPGAEVTASELFFATGTSTSGRTTTRIRVRGTVRFYRAQPR